MALTRDFRQTIQDRAQKDPAFRKAMVTEAIDTFLSGELETGKAMLRDYINATIGFETLSKKIQKPSKSLHRMLSPAGIKITWLVCACPVGPEDPTGACPVGPADRIGACG
jgi:hypothetical protein